MGEREAEAGRHLFCLALLPCRPGRAIVLPYHFPVLGLHRRCETAASLNARPMLCAPEIHGFQIVRCWLCMVALCRGPRNKGTEVSAALAPASWAQHILHMQWLWRKSRLWLMVAYIVPLSLCQPSQEEHRTGSQDQRPHPSCPSTSPCPV